MKNKSLTHRLMQLWLSLNLHKPTHFSENLMMQTIFILLIFMLFGSSCQKNDSKKEKSILYLHYEKKNVEVIEEIDDFSEYYPLVKAYYYDGELKYNGKEKILFESYNDKGIISNFPFTYSNIRIDSISNDTTIHITVEDKNYTISPNHTYEDSLQSLHYRAILIKDRIFDNNNKFEKKIELRLDAPTEAATMPVFNYNAADLDSYLNDYGIKQYNEKSLNNAYIQIVINEYGNITYIRLYRRVDSNELTKRIIKAFNEMPKWIPAKNGNKSVPIKMIFELNEI